MRDDVEYELDEVPPHPVHKHACALNAGLARALYAEGSKRAGVEQALVVVEERRECRPVAENELVYLDPRERESV